MRWDYCAMMGIGGGDRERGEKRKFRERENKKRGLGKVNNG